MQNSKQPLERIKLLLGIFLSLALHSNFDLNLKTCNQKLLFTEFRNENISDEELEKQGIIRVNGWLDVEKVLL